MFPIDDAWSAGMEAEALAGRQGSKLAFVRVSFNYFMSEAVFDYIVEAVHLIADEGWKLLPLYRFDPGHGSVAPRAGGRAPLLSLDEPRPPERSGVRPTRRCEPESALAALPR